MLFTFFSFHQGAKALEEFTDSIRVSLFFDWIFFLTQWLFMHIYDEQDELLGIDNACEILSLTKFYVL